uniref:Uncharacterized protein n=1 Tax=Vitis vinifera TaxID=29760 RepID=F6I1D3_VITVI
MGSDLNHNKPTSELKALGVRQVWFDLMLEIVQALYGIEEGIFRGLWVDSSLSYSKGKKPGSGPRPLDVGTIGMMGHRSPCRPQTQKAVFRYLLSDDTTLSVQANYSH